MCLFKPYYGKIDVQLYISCILYSCRNSLQKKKCAKRGKRAEKGKRAKGSRGKKGEKVGKNH